MYAKRLSNYSTHLINLNRKDIFMADTMTVIKKKSFSHCAAEELQSGSIQCYSQWIRHSYNTFVVKESAPGFMEMFDNRNLMAYLDDHESFVYRHRTLPNRAGMEF
mgnify:CR=1 FL=1